MADKKISELDAAAALTGTEVAPLVQSGGNVKATIQQITTAVTGATGTNGETVTTNKPRLDLTQTWNAVGTTFTGLKFNATDTASATGSLLMDLQVGGVSQLRVAKNGLAIFGQTGSFLNGVGVAVTSINVGDGANTTSIFAGSQINVWTSNLNVSSLNSGGLVLRATSTIAWGSGTSVSSPDLFLVRDAAQTLAQRNSTNAQTFRIYNTFTDASNYERGKMEWASNVLRIGTEKAGTGTARALEFQTDGVTRVTVGTGLSDALVVAGSLNLSSGSQFYGWSSLTRLHCDSVNGNLRISNTAGNDFNLLRFGGTTSSFPALKRSTTSLQARLADDSAFTNIQGKLTTETAYTAGAPTATGYLVLYDSNGTAYKVPAEAL